MLLEQRPRDERAEAMEGVSLLHQKMWHGLLASSTIRRQTLSGRVEAKPFQAT